MFTRIRAGVLAVSSSLAVVAAVAPSAHAGLLSLAPGSCGQQETQPFAPWGDSNSYVLLPGGSFEAGAQSWTLRNGAKLLAGNESYKVSGPGSRSLSLPAGSSASSPATCTGIDHPSARFFVRNTGSSSSRLKVYATYPILLGLPYTAYLGEVSGSATWQPSSPVQLGLNNIIGSVSLTESTISFTFVPADSSGSWSVDDVYLDPFCRR